MNALQTANKHSVTFIDWYGVGQLFLLIINYTKKLLWAQALLYRGGTVALCQRYAPPAPPSAVQ